MNKMPERIRIKDIAQLAGVSVGTVDRVLHGRTGVAESSRKKVEEILKQLDYQPNMYASALASNKKYHFICLLPQHNPNEYWTDVENGIDNAVKSFSDFHITFSIVYYDQYVYSSFTESGERVLDMEPDGVILAPTIPETTFLFVKQLEGRSIPYIFIDSNIPSLNPLAFYGQKSDQSGYFAGRMIMMLGKHPSDIVVFRQINEGRVGSNQQENREKGFRRYMDEHYPSCHIYELDLSAKRPEENEILLIRFFEEHPEVNCGITFCSKVYMIGEYLLKCGNKDFKLLGYDLLDRNVNCLKQGAIDFLIAQQPTAQGYNSIESLCNHLIFKKEVKQYNYMPITLLTEENVDYYLELHRKK
ncbi:MAG: LacI family DNA-binding transcriptional regulator [Bacteroides sp.]|nr:LacI family DNA-binding transcriptional regulator [Bacteroides sp.]